MRIIIKPLGVTVMALVLGGSFFALARGISSPGKAPFAFPSFGINPHANMVSSDHWKLYTENGAMGAMDAITASPAGAPLPGFHIAVDGHTNRPWNIGINNPLKLEFKANEKLTLHFWARAQKDSKVDVMMQKNTPGFPDCFRKEYSIGTEWKEYEGVFTTIPMATYESMLAFHCGYQDGWVEVAGIELER